MTVQVTFNEADFTRADDLLRRLDRRVRKEAVHAAMKAASDIVVEAAKREVPQPGYPFDKPSKKPLRDTISFEIRDYPPDTVVSVVGPQYPAGAHAHLVEQGHEIWVPKPPFTEGADAERTGKRTQPDPFMERASDNTQGRQASAIVNTLSRFADTVR